MQISQVLRNKPNAAVLTISPQATVREVVALLVEHNVGALVVSADGVGVDGIVSERDVVRRLHEDAAILEARVELIMTADVFTCDPAGSVEDLMSLMTKHRVRHIPVVADGKLTGVISIGDVVKSRMAQLEFERDQLDNYLRQS